MAGGSSGEAAAGCIHHGRATRALWIVPVAALIAVAAKSLARIRFPWFILIGRGISPGTIRQAGGHAMAQGILLWIVVSSASCSRFITVGSAPK